MTLYTVYYGRRIYITHYNFLCRIEYEMGPSDDIKALDTVAARELSEEEKELLNLYQHSFDDDKVDIELILSLVIKILSTSKEGMLIMKTKAL